MARITQADKVAKVAAIEQALRCHIYTQKEIAKLHGCSLRMVSDVAKGTLSSDTLNNSIIVNGNGNSNGNGNVTKPIKQALSNLDFAHFKDTPTIEEAITPKVATPVQAKKEDGFWLTKAEFEMCPEYVQRRVLNRLRKGKN